MSSNVNLLLLTLIFLCGDSRAMGLWGPIGSIMDNLSSSSPLSFFLPMHVEQEALHSIQQEANDNYDDFITSWNRDFEICMGKLMGLKCFGI